MDRDCKIPIEAAELWMIPVTTVPARTPRKGLWNAVRSAVNSSISRRGAMDVDIIVIPCMRMAKPIAIEPISLCLCCLQTMSMMIPIRATMRAKHEGFRNCRKILSLPSIPESDKIHAVSVVPISEPKITPTVWGSSMIPELTKPISMTVMADDDWMAIVIIAPMVSPLKGLSVALRRSFSSLPPAVFFNDSERTRIP